MVSPFLFSFSSILYHVIQTSFKRLYSYLGEEEDVQDVLVLENNGDKEMAVAF